MAEAAEHKEAGEAHGAAEAGPAGEHSGTHAEHEGGKDPLHHIKDQVLWGVDANGGSVRYQPYEHGHAKEFAGIAYMPQKAGPFKLEFTQHMLDVTIVAVLLVFILTAMANRILKNVRADQAPQGPLANLAEVCLTFVRDELVIPTGGHHLAPYTPLFITYFLFILFTNYIGMIPMVGTATGNIAVTAALGGSILVILTCLGMYKQGPLNYFVHMVPPGTPWWLWGPLWVLEFMGPLIKSFVLCMRLFGNMIAGHLVVSNVLGMAVIGKGAMLSTGLGVFMIFVGVPLSLGISTLELLVCFLQAYVFTMLSIIFVGAAVHPEH